MHLLAIHIPDAQSFPFVQGFPDLPEPVDNIIFMDARLDPPLTDAVGCVGIGTGAAGMGMGIGAAGVSMGGGGGMGRAGISWNPSRPIRRPILDTNFCVRQKISTKARPCTAAAASLEPLLGNRTKRPGVSAVKRAAI
jgi:hypothetical protein